MSASSVSTPGSVAGRALFGGLMTPAFVEQSLLGPDPDPGWPFKLDAFINIVRHAGHYLALEEGTPPYEVSRELDTIGRFDFGGQLPLGMCAHPRFDPVTGDMVVFRYDMEPPYLTWAAVAADGSLTQPPTKVPCIDRPFMIHDFMITVHYALFVIGPAVLSLDGMLNGSGALDWQPELGARVVAVPRTSVGPPVMVTLEPFWVWHFANAYEDGTTVVADFPWWDGLTLAAGESRAPQNGHPAHRPAAGWPGHAHREQVATVTGWYGRAGHRLPARGHGTASRPGKRGCRSDQQPGDTQWHSGGQPGVAGCCHHGASSRERARSAS